jgi:hypothetical protein
MSELRTPPYAATEEMIAEYVRRCDILMRDVFFASDAALMKFREWLFRRFERGDAVMLLHDAPLYTIGRYIGKNPSQMSAHVIEHATQISIQNGWTKT